MDGHRVRLIDGRAVFVSLLSGPTELTTSWRKRSRSLNAPSTWRRPRDESFSPSRAWMSSTLSGGVEAVAGERVAEALGRSVEALPEFAWPAPAPPRSGE